MAFNLVVVLTKNYAIRYADKIPWDSKQFVDYFDNLTKDGIIVMGRKTFEGLPLTMRPIKGRLNVILSTEYPKYQDLSKPELAFTNINFLDNKIIPENSNKDIWVVGGRQVYEALSNRCTNIYIISLDKAVPNPDLLFVDILPHFELVDYSKTYISDTEQCKCRILKYTRNFDSPCMRNENQYLIDLRKILETGTSRDDRTGVGTISLFGGQQKYDVSKYLPLLTTKFVPLRIIIKELLWFLCGHTDAKILQSEGVHIWDGNSSREFLDKRGLTHYEIGELGPIYSHQWRHFGSEYTNCHADYEGKGFDQIEYILDLLVNDPFSRRIIMSSWNPTDIEKMALPPCHVMFQLYVEEDPSTGKRYISGHLYQRSSDYFLAANYNLVSYTILLYILAKKVGYYPKDMIMSFGDQHIYKNHIDQVKLQLARNPRPQPVLVLSDLIKDKSWNEITVDDFELIGYMPYPAIKAEMAV